MSVTEAEELLAKYKKEEEFINLKINQVSNAKTENYNTHQNMPNIGTLHQAKARNNMILRNLETAKGNLRSKAIFSPTEIQWKNLYHKYQYDPALSICKWKCLPVFV